MIDGLPPLREIVAQYQLIQKKSLGQHFLFDLNVTDRVVRSAGDLKGVTVIEVGPGPGGLTRSLLKTDVHKVIAIEHDERAVNALQDYLVPASQGRLEVLNQDALLVDIESLVSGPRKIIANLPYNISTQLLVKWLKNMLAYEGLTLMFQKEVADRIVGKVGSKMYGRLSVVAQNVAHIHYDFTLDKRAFVPPPKVQSAVITFTPRANPLVDIPFPIFSQTVGLLFQQRRKTIKKIIRPMIAESDTFLAKHDIDPLARPETLTVPVIGQIVREIISN